MFKEGDEVEIIKGCGFNENTCKCSDHYIGQTGVVRTVGKVYCVVIINGDTYRDFMHTSLVHANVPSLDDFI